MAVYKSFNGIKTDSLDVNGKPDVKKVNVFQSNISQINGIQSLRDRFSPIGITNDNPIQNMNPHTKNFYEMSNPADYLQGQYNATVREYFKDKLTTTEAARDENGNLLRHVVQVEPDEETLKKAIEEFKENPNAIDMLQINEEFNDRLASETTQNRLNLYRKYNPDAEANIDAFITQHAAETRAVVDKEMEEPSIDMDTLCNEMGADTDMDFNRLRELCKENGCEDSFNAYIMTGYKLCVMADAEKNVNELEWNLSPDFNQNNHYMAYRDEKLQNMYNDPQVLALAQEMQHALEDMTPAVTQYIAERDAESSKHNTEEYIIPAESSVVEPYVPGETHKPQVIGPAGGLVQPSGQSSNQHIIDNGGAYMADGTYVPFKDGADAIQPNESNLTRARQAHMVLQGEPMRQGSGSRFENKVDSAFQGIKANAAKANELSNDGLQNS